MWLIVAYIVLALIGNIIIYFGPRRRSLLRKPDFEHLFERRSRNMRRRSSTTPGVLVL
jgi:hypothetical protein